MKWLLLLLGLLQDAGVAHVDASRPPSEDEEVIRSLDFLESLDMVSDLDLFVELPAEEDSRGR